MRGTTNRTAPSQRGARAHLLHCQRCIGRALEEPRLLPEEVFEELSDDSRVFPRTVPQRKQLRDDCAPLRIRCRARGGGEPGGLVGRVGGAAGARARAAGRRRVDGAADRRLERRDVGVQRCELALLRTQLSRRDLGVRLRLVQRLRRVAQQRCEALGVAIRHRALRLCEVLLRALLGALRRRRRVFEVISSKM